MTKTPPEFPPEITAAIRWLPHTGCQSFEVRYSDPDDGRSEPLIWMAIGEWRHEGKRLYEVGAATNPFRAVVRLCEQAVDGGKCTKCDRGTAFAIDPKQIFLPEELCWYTYNAETGEIQQGCPA